MNPNKALYVNLVIAPVLVVLHFIGSAKHFYFTYWWFDIMMHFLGGVIVFLLSSWFYARFLKEDLSLRAFIFALVSVLAVGSAWEIYENVIKLTYRAFGSYRFDTIKDVLVDMAGAFIAFLVLNRLNRHE
jgi:uncharacterized membrane protein YjdF